MPVVRVAAQRDQEALHERAGERVLVEQRPAGQLNEEAGELGLAAACEAADQDENGTVRVAARVPALPRVDDPLLQVEVVGFVRARRDAMNGALNSQNV
ncbi:hypothetical protein GCM10010353_50670 [Streptomyces chryseus]|nr:hypothetical protein GCM10010353_50670 [Streptomyces chryseus]